jgi:hypothetical protein
LEVWRKPISIFGALGNFEQAVAPIDFVVQVRARVKARRLAATSVFFGKACDLVPRGPFIAESDQNI